MKLYEVEIKKEDMENILADEILITKNINFKKGDLINLVPTKTIKTSQTDPLNRCKTIWSEKRVRQEDEAVLIEIESIRTHEEIEGLKLNYCVIRYTTCKIITSRGEALMGKQNGQETI